MRSSENVRAARWVAAIVVALAASIVAALALRTGRSAPRRGIHKIQHVVVIVQENRSFDSYFGRYPGADGIPAGICVPDPKYRRCVRPFVDHHDANVAGPHSMSGVDPVLRTSWLCRVSGLGVADLVLVGGRCHVAER